MGSITALQRQGTGLILSLAYGLCGVLYILPVSMWVFSTFQKQSSICLAGSKFLLGMSVCVCVCMMPCILARVYYHLASSVPGIQSGFNRTLTHSQTDDDLFG